MQYDMLFVRQNGRYTTPETTIRCCYGSPRGLPATIEYIEDIYFFQVNTKYISSSAVNKISIFHECVADIFTTRDEIYFVFALKKVNFLFILYSTEIQKSQPYFLLGRFSFDLTFAVCLLGTTDISLRTTGKGYFAVYLIKLFILIYFKIFWQLVYKTVTRLR